MDAVVLAKACADVMWSADRASQSMGMNVEGVSPGCATLSMTVVEEMANGHGLCHGGLIFSLADSAFAFACNSENLITVAAGARIDYISPAKLGDKLTAVAMQVSQGRRTGVYDVEVTNQDAKPIAIFRGNAYRIGTKLVEEETGVAAQ